MPKVGVGLLAVVVFAGGFFAGHLTGLDRGAAEIAGTQVPVNLSCEEDEVIGFFGIPDTLDCVHIESVVK